MSDLQTLIENGRNKIELERKEQESLDQLERMDARAARDNKWRLVEGAIKGWLPAALYPYINRPEFDVETRTIHVVFRIPDLSPFLMRVSIWGGDRVDCDYLIISSVIPGADADWIAEYGAEGNGPRYKFTTELDLDRIEVALARSAEVAQEMADEEKEYRQRVLDVAAKEVEKLNDTTQAQAPEETQEVNIPALLESGYGNLEAGLPMTAIACFMGVLAAGHVELVKNVEGINVSGINVYNCS